MAVYNFSVENYVVVINGRTISNWSSDDALQHESIDDPSELKRGLGMDALRLDRMSPGRRYTLTLQPGSKDSAYMQGLMNSRADIELSTQQLQTRETTLAWEGIITNDGQTTRGTQSPTGDKFVMEFNKFQQTRG